MYYKVEVNHLWQGYYQTFEDAEKAALLFDAGRIGRFADPGGYELEHPLQTWCMAAHKSCLLAIGQAY